MKDFARQRNGRGHEKDIDIRNAMTLASAREFNFN
jgi:hypothetical protein